MADTTTAREIFKELKSLRKQNLKLMKTEEKRMVDDPEAGVYYGVYKGKLDLIDYLLSKYQNK